MNNTDRIVPFSEFMEICHSAKSYFGFLESTGLELTEENWPSGDSFKDGFSLTYTGSKVSVVVEYYDMEFDVVFQNGNEKISYLFIDYELMSHQSGLGGCMFTRGKLPSVMERVSKDIQQNYSQVISGNQELWEKVIAKWHSPREKKKLP